MFLKKFLNEVFNFRTRLDADMEPLEHTIYAGPEIEQNGKGFEFWVLMRSKDGAPGNNEVMLPCTAKDPEVIESLKAMKPGQSFEITKEEDGYDPIGTMVIGIKTGPEFPVFELTGTEPHSLEAGP